jgi:hypothetical protein
MDAETRASILDEALSQLETGDEPLRVLSRVFNCGYGYGLAQGRQDLPARKPAHRHNQRGVNHSCLGCLERAAGRYAQQAKSRLATRVGEDLAEEFTSVAASTERDIVNTAELMAAAYLMGQQAVTARPPSQDPGSGPLTRAGL